MLKPIQWKLLSRAQQSALLERPTQKLSIDFKYQVQQVIDRVREAGDTALFSFTKQFDQVDIKTLQVTEEELGVAMNQVSSAAMHAFEYVISQLTRFHQSQIISDYSVETLPGILCESKTRPLQHVGLYIPAGSAPLVSTVLMLGVPSRLAKCPVRVMCSPPNFEGKIDPHILVAAKLCGIEKIFKVGGAQAIAAMAYGTASIPKVDKIFGPGNSWVTTAKMLVSLDPRGALLDMPAGPSEVLIIADEYANSNFVAADLLSQAEHGVDSQVMLICTYLGFAKEVIHAIKSQLKTLSRKEIANASLKNSRFIVVDSIEEGLEISNSYVPEHLILAVTQPRQYLSKVHQAGSIFLGAWSPEAAGDYASGTNHVLPTGGFAKSCSGLSVRDFMKTLTIQELTKVGLASIAKTVRVLTGIEGLDGHRLAIDIRLQEGLLEVNDVPC
jgi:histidinol dehydrogenase